MAITELPDEPIENIKDDMESQKAELWTLDFW